MKNMMIVEIAFNLLKLNLTSIRESGPNIQLNIKGFTNATAMKYVQIAGGAK